MAGFRIEGDATANVAEVTTNKELKVALGQTHATAGYARIMSEIDAGTITGTALLSSPRTSFERRLRIGTDSLLFQDYFSATAQNTGKWKHVFATMTTTQASGLVTMNSNLTGTTTTGCGLQTWRHFSLPAQSSLLAEATINITAQPLANQVWESGIFFLTAATTAPAEGVYFRFSSSGLIGVTNYNNVETPTGVLLAANLFTSNQSYRLGIEINEDIVRFYRDDILLGSLANPASVGQSFMFDGLPYSFVQRNSGAVSGSPQMQMRVASVSVTVHDIPRNTTWGAASALMGCAYQGLNGGTMGTLALYTNSLAAGAGAAMTNTAALGSGLGGQFAALPTLAAGTDGILCSYQNPQGTINQSPRTLVITGVRIQGAVTTTLTGGPVLYAYSLAFGHTNVSMVTAETGSFVTATTKAPRRIALGLSTFVVTAAAGALGEAVYFPFQNPVVVHPGEFVAICAKNLGTVTTLGVITHLVTFDHYFE